PFLNCFLSSFCRSCLVLSKNLTANMPSRRGCEFRKSTHTSGSPSQVTHSLSSLARLVIGVCTRPYSSVVSSQGSPANLLQYSVMSTWCAVGLSFLALSLGRISKARSRLNDRLRSLDCSQWWTFCQVSLSRMLKRWMARFTCRSGQCTTWLFQ